MMRTGPIPETDTDALLVAEGVTVGYGREAVVEDVTFTIRKGEFVALVGPNGSGKSTLLHALLGVSAPWAGRVSLFGHPATQVRDGRRVGYVPQRPSLGSEIPATVREIVATGRLERGAWARRATDADATAVVHAIRSVGLEDEADTPIHELSAGQQQRAFIARAFAGEPGLLVLDEPIAGVDADSQRRFRDSLVHLIEEHGAGVLLVSHELSAVASDLDRVLVLKRRLLFDGTPEDLAERGVSLGIHEEDLPLWLEALR
ncbi:MAG TPA: metal ABC transporter ATP-binding protein [Actinomycetota bacterium]